MTHTALTFDGLITGTRVDVDIELSADDTRLGMQYDHALAIALQERLGGRLMFICDRSDLWEAAQAGEDTDTVADAVDADLVLHVCLQMPSGFVVNAVAIDHPDRVTTWTMFGRHNDGITAEIATPEQLDRLAAKNPAQADANVKLIADAIERQARASGLVEPVDPLTVFRLAQGLKHLSERIDQISDDEKLIAARDYVFGRRHDDLGGMREPSAIAA